MFGKNSIFIQEIMFLIIVLVKVAYNKIRNIIVKIVHDALALIMCINDRSLHLKIILIVYTKLC